MLAIIVSKLSPLLANTFSPQEIPVPQYETQSVHTSLFSLPIEHIKSLTFPRTLSRLSPHFIPKQSRSAPS